MSDIGRCRSCPASVRWVVMVKSGRRNPLNVNPDAAKGNVLILTGLDADLYGGRPGMGVALSADAALAERGRGTALYTSHFMDCVGREQHRKSTTRRSSK